MMSNNLFMIPIYPCSCVACNVSFQFHNYESDPEYPELQALAIAWSYHLGCGRPHVWWVS